MTTSPLKVEDSRAQFEHEMSKLGNIVDMRRAKNGDEEYMAWDVALAWRFWQLSRAAIVIELPEGITTRQALDAGYMSDYAAGMDDGIEQTAKTIRAAGITAKGD